MLRLPVSLETCHLTITIVTLITDRMSGAGAPGNPKQSITVYVYDQQ